MKTIKITLLCLSFIFFNCSKDSSDSKDELPIPIGEMVIFANSPEARSFDVSIPYLGKNCESLAFTIDPIVFTDVTVDVWAVNLGDVLGYDPQTHNYNGSVNTLINAQIDIDNILYAATQITYNLSFTPFEEFTCFAGQELSGSLMTATVNLTMIPLDSNNGTEEIEVTFNLTDIQVVNDCAC